MRRSSLASPARAIQRKRIHSLSTGLTTACAAAALLVAGCGSGGGSGGGKFALTPELTMMTGCDQTSRTCQLSPNAQATLTFVLTQGGRPAAGQTVSFAIIESSSDPSPQAAIMSAPTAVTDRQGHVSVTVQAGSADFILQAQFFQAPAQPVPGKVTIVVATGPTGTVLVAPFLTPAASPLPSGTTIQILFYNRTDCARLDVNQPAPSARTITLDSLSAPPARFTTVETSGANAAIGVANSGNGVVANGCVDIPGSSIVAGQTVEVALPLDDASPDPVGSYHVTSTLTFAPPLAAAAALAAPWADLADCPLDPGELWLDCTIDALSPATPADPLDCVPATAPGGEGALGDAIAALRGVPLTDGTGAPTGCRSALDAAHDPALDARVLGLFGSPAPAALVALPAIAADAAAILDSIQVESTLVVAPGSALGGYAVTHTLTTARFGPGWQIPVALASLALPTLEAFTSATVSDGALVIGSQDFTLRLGSAARAAFGPLSLVPRGLPADVPSFVSALFALAQAPGGSATGCAALDALVCPAAGAAAGCLLDACAAGLGALTGRLNGAFATADGTGIDLSLSGSASLIGPNGVAQRLGTTSTGASPTATWTATLRTSLGSAQVVAPFEGVRN